MPQPFVFRTIELDGQTIRTAVRPGSSSLTPLLIFNGIGANLELVMPFVRALDPDLEVIAFDVPGVGGSSTPSTPYRFPGLAKLAARMLDYLDYGQVNAIGVSWGGALAQQFAHDYPERCKKLVLAATSAGAVMVPGKPKVLWRMASPKRYIQPSYGVHIAPDIYGGAFRRDRMTDTTGRETNSYNFTVSVTVVAGVLCHTRRAPHIPCSPRRARKSP